MFWRTIQKGSFMLMTWILEGLHSLRMHIEVHSMSLLMKEDRGKLPGSHLDMLSEGL